MVLHAFSISDMSWTGMVDDVPVCIFGAICYDRSHTTGVPWFLATDEILKYQKTFLSMSRPYLQRMQAAYSRLENWVDVNNTSSIKWLKWLGAEFFGPEPCGPDNAPFWRFEIGGRSC